MPLKDAFLAHCPEVQVSHRLVGSTRATGARHDSRIGKCRYGHDGKRNRCAKDLSYLIWIPPVDSASASFPSKLSPCSD